MTTFETDLAEAAPHIALCTHIGLRSGCGCALGAVYAHAMGLSEARMAVIIEWILPRYGWTRHFLTSLMAGWDGREFNAFRDRSGYDLGVRLAQQYQPQDGRHLEDV